MVRHAERIGTAAGLAIGLLLCGCGGSGTGGGGIFNQPAPRLRMVNGLPQVASMDAVISGKAQPDPVTTTLAYGTVSGTQQQPYDILTQRQNQTVTVYDDAAPTVPVTTFNHNFTFGDKITAIVYGQNSSAQTIQLFDNATNAPSAADVRIVDAAANMGAVDFFLVPTGQANSNSHQLSPGDVFPQQTTNTDNNYTLIPSVDKMFTINVYPQGNDTGTPLLAQQVQINTSDRLTLVLLDAPQGSATPQLLVIHDNNSNAG